MQSIAETNRILLREITVKDAEFAYQLNLDIDVIRYTGDNSFKSVKEAYDFIAAYNQYKKYGFGRWMVLEKSTQACLGWCGLKYNETENEFDIGFRFFKKYWNKGYATESALLSLDLAFQRFNIPVIVGRAMKENTASIKVLKKIGLAFWKDEMLGGKEGEVYRKINPALVNYNEFQ